MKYNDKQIKKTYKPKLYRIILNVVYSILGVIVLFYLLTYFISNINIIVIISLLFLVGYYKIVIYNTYATICIDNKLIYKNKNKIKSYDIDKCKFSAKIVTTNGDSECVLNITDENGNIDYIDCELIGFSQFNNLLNDLKIIGDEANPIKIKTITKGVER